MEDVLVFTKNRIILTKILFSYLTAQSFQWIHCIRCSTCCTIQSEFFVRPSSNLNSVSP